MKLIRARVTNYRSIDDSGWVNIDGVTCLVGKNESGKTAFLGALKELNPVYGASAGFDLKDYPRKGYTKYWRQHKTEPAIVVRAEFRLEEEEIRQIEAEYGAGVMPSTLVTVSKDYSNARMWDFEVDEATLVRHIVNEAGLPAEIEERTAASSTVEELLSMLKRLEIKPPVVGDLLIEVSSRFDMSLRDRIAKKYLERLLPTFVYFDDYSAMKGRISIPDLRRRSEDRDRLDDADRTFKSLDIAGRYRSRRP